MSFESVIEHMQRELVAGAARRRRRERLYRGIGAVAVALAIIGGAVALTRGEEDGVSQLSTEPTIATLGDARIEACNKFLDLQTNAPLPGPALVAALEQFAATAATSGDTTLAKIAAMYRKSNLTAEGQVSSENAIRAHNDLIAHCRAIGTPGLNPVFVPATTSPPPRVDLRTYGTEQRLEPIGGQRPSGAALALGRDLSPVEVAVSNRGGYVMTWTYNQGGPGNVRRCRAYGTERSGGVSCGVLDDAKSQLPSRPLILSSGGNVGDPSTAIEVSDSTAFVVLEAAGQRFVQQPVAGITLFIWQLDGSSGRVDLIARAYDSDGQTLGCVASGSGVC